MSVHESGEMYLEAILVLGKKRPLVRSVDVAEYLGYSKPSVSRAMGILRGENYISVGKSGGLTLNAGLLRTVGDRVVLTLDIRSPVTVESGRVRAAIEAACAPYGLSVACTEDMKSIYMDKNGRVITAMLEVYREVTGDLSEPTVIGGGTYARAMPGIVAFGPMQPGRECTEHQKDEYILLEDLFQAEEIYRRTIEKLANLEEIE